jgi:class 3 adenylate cyclase
VTVLFCDLVGSTALAERLGPDLMHDLLSRFFELALAEVHRYEGTVNQFLGDGIMALFGAPIAHEERPPGGTAIGIRRRLRRAGPTSGCPKGRGCPFGWAAPGRWLSAESATTFAWTTPPWATYYQPGRTARSPIRPS